MKRLSLILMAFAAVLFVSCDKSEKTNSQNDSKEVPVTLELTIDDGSKTDFSDFLTDGFNAKIKWNSTGTETVYMAIPNIKMYNPTTGDILYEEKCATLLPLTATCDGSSTLVFTGSIDARYLEDGKSYTLYYFGDDANTITPSNSDGKIHQITKRFYSQDGTRDNLGNHHFATLDVRVDAVYAENSNLAQSYNLVASYPNFVTQIGIAYLAMGEETQLFGTTTNGNDIKNTVLVTFNTNTNKYDVEFVKYTENNCISITKGGDSFVVLAPGTKVVNIVDKSYTFENAVEANNVYFNYNTTTNEIEPLKWQ